ncbi:short-chain dehydrogenase/reductase family 16C member 6-like [Athalia rosae]|uniref:short-chain dehydrogenase/reductase family 16C member 6-like n=1 Tax=Athalia rosae TaxID=37344 RepID=UPI000626DBA4|nr:short-chain dehydrogenase/reductase family 16C member 6-like [Athalia rosae]XP_012260068.1 short-chain dehydrogenase/reductase family 16C member 6-like [Athalia rosae]XP_012260069.1 short-chain dehydrogenase/reductase family 16C member 6-like [Athalia rosae]XP_048506351.1 short-chain dehydrogenase/reductase family 16C member 6-like [Athalia rosae]
MFSQSDEASNSNTRASSLPTIAFLFLGVEVLAIVLISLLLALLTVIKRLLPKPPRDLTNDKVVVTGAKSGLGKAIADEFFKAGCIVASIDHDYNSEQERTYDSTSQYQRIEEFESHDEFYHISTHRRKFFYKCAPTDRQEILDVAQEIQRDIGPVNVLITCAGDSGQDILDTVSTNLMNHYWTMLAFVPSMLQCKQSHVVAVLPTTSTEDAYLGSKAAVAGLVGAIGQQFSRANQLIFTTVAPKAEPRLMEQTEQQTARDIVEAVRRDQETLSSSWRSHVLYPVCYTVHEAIGGLTSWLYRQSCDDPT